MLTGIKTNIVDQNISPDVASFQKDEKTPSTDPKYGEVWKKIQEQYGAKPEKPREIKKTLGKDDFLRIMVTQMKNQDPTQPFKAEQFASELAQYASVEQLQNINKSIGTMAKESQPFERLAMTQLIGKTITTSVKEQGKVKIIGVSFEGGEPMFLVGNLQKPEKIALKDIVKIEATTDDDPKNIQNQLKTPQTETATDTATETETGPAPQPNVFTFKRGEGSKNIDKISPEQKQAIENFAKIQKQAHLMKTEDRGGFPNGLQDYEQEGGHKQ